MPLCTYSCYQPVKSPNPMSVLSGEHFTSSHNDGSYVTWEVGGAGGERPLKEPVTPYGPYPCKAITKLLNRTTTTGDELTIYAGQCALLFVCSFV